MTEEELKNIFAQYGEVTGVRLVSDRETGRAKGFGFVEMADDAQANAAIVASGRHISTPPSISAHAPA